jgi:hypothetical protein
MDRETPVDKEIRDKHYRIVGMLQALESSAKSVYCMPCDKTTAALLDAARQIINKACTSAWEYAELQTALSAAGDQ